MKWKNTSLRMGLYLLSALILLIGAGSAALIYRAAINSNSDEGYEIIGGFIYPSSVENSKRYVHDLQLYGGNAAVLADDFMRWFAGLWHGTSLAFTVACIAFFLSFIIFVAANNVQAGFSSDAPCDNKRE